MCLCHLCRLKKVFWASVNFRSYKLKTRSLLLLGTLSCFKQFETKRSWDIWKTLVEGRKEAHKYFLLWMHCLTLSCHLVVNPVAAPRRKKCGVLFGHCSFSKVRAHLQQVQRARHTVMLHGSVRTLRDERFGSGLDFAVWAWHWQDIFGDNLTVCSPGTLCKM